VFVEVGRHTDEQRASARATECAGERAEGSGGDAVQDLAAGRHAHHPVADGVGKPDGTLGVQCGAVWRCPEAVRHEADVGQRRRGAERGPVAARSQSPVGLYVEGRDAVAHGLADDQGLSVGCDHAAIGKVELARHGAHRSVGIHPHQRGGLRGAATHEVKAEVADVGTALGIDHHVVGVAARHGGQVGVGDEPAIGFLAQYLSLAHGHHQQAPVGQPAHARRLSGHVGDLLHTALQVHAQDLVRVEVRQPQPVVVPAGTLQEGVPRDENRETRIDGHVASCVLLNGDHRPARRCHASRTRHTRDTCVTLVPCFTRSSTSTRPLRHSPRWVRRAMVAGSAVWPSLARSGRCSHASVTAPATPCVGTRCKRSTAAAPSPMPPVCWARAGVGQRRCCKGWLAAGSQPAWGVTPT
jgi:hypothetical protein